MNFGEVQISWINMAKVSEYHRKSFAFENGESLYLFSATPAEAMICAGKPVSSTMDCIMATATLSSPPTVDETALSDCEDKVLARSASVSRMGRSRLISLSEKAVREEGSCTWLGYDKSIDMRARSSGFARLDDDRLFFAKLNCS